MLKIASHARALQEMACGPCFNNSSRAADFLPCIRALAVADEVAERLSHGVPSADPPLPSRRWEPSKNS